MVNFLDLPTEIRLRIYQYLYASKPSYLILYLEIGNRRIYEIPTHRGILGASQQCYEEAIALHQESLTHLFVECDKFSVFQPTEQRYEAVMQYHRMFRSMFWRTPLDAQKRQLLADVRRLTVPSFISADGILNIFERYGLISLDTIEFVSHDAPLLDQYAALPVDEMHTEYYNLASAQYFARPNHWLVSRPLRWHKGRTFRPTWHVCRSGFGWNSVNELECEARRDLPGGQFRVLWTAKVRWTRERLKASDDEPEIVYRSAGVGPFCCLIEFKYTFDCTHQKLENLQILSKANCEIEGCLNQDDESAFMNYLGPEARELLSKAVAEKGPIAAPVQRAIILHSALKQLSPRSKLPETRLHGVAFPASDVYSRLLSSDASLED